MRFFQWSLLCSLLISLFGFEANAKTSRYSVLSEFRKLRTVPADYSNSGSVCEELARLRLQEKYPQENFHIMVGLQYFEGSRTVGELDIVVFRISDGEAILIAEVKCWKNLRGALQKANKQLSRFKKYRENHQISRFETLDSYYATVSMDQVEYVSDMIVMGQNGSSRHGFDQDIGLSLEDAKELRLRLLNCQRESKCPALK